MVTWWIRTGHKGIITAQCFNARPYRGHGGVASEAHSAGPILLRILRDDSHTVPNFPSFKSAIHSRFL
jgi:hypothetical protein